MEESRACADSTSREQWVHSRVPCLHTLCPCSVKSPHCDQPPARYRHRHSYEVGRQEHARYESDDDIVRHHHHHNYHHYHHHHHHHNEQHSSSSPSSSLSSSSSMGRSLEVVSLHRCLTLIVFVMSWAAVCAAPRRIPDASLSNYDVDAERSNFLLPDVNPSPPEAAISAVDMVEELLEQLQRSKEVDNLQTQSALPSSASSSVTSTSWKTGSEPVASLLPNGIPPLDSVNSPGMFPALMSQRVAFSAERPQTPPWPGDSTFDAGYDLKDDSANTTTTSTARSRRRRSTSDLEEVCESTSGWAEKRWGTDMYGQNVTILARIMSTGNFEVKQWFYETACARPHGVQTCLGIDDSRYESLCLTKKAWVYAMIRNARGEKGWSWVAISTSCNCAIRERRVDGMR